MWYTSWVKIHPCFQRRTLQGVRSGWIFTHTSGGWTWELTCWDGLRRWQPGCKQWRETGPATTAELCPELRAASDSSWQLVTHRNTNKFYTLFPTPVSYSVDHPRLIICTQCNTKHLYKVGVKTVNMSYTSVPYLDNTSAQCTHSEPEWGGGGGETERNLWEKCHQFIRVSARL